MFAPTVPFRESTPFAPTDAFGASPTEPPQAACAFSSTLSPSLIADLNRFADEPGRIDLLPALAASVRHGKSLALELQNRHGRFRLSVFPREQLFHSTVDLCRLPMSDYAGLQLVGLGPETTLEPFDAAGRPMGTLPFTALPPLLWLLAEHGARDELLPEIAGPVRYRMAPGFETHGLPVEATAMPLFQRLRASTSSLQELSEWTVRGPTRVRRLLNALYLQSGLIVSRVPPLPARTAGA